MSHLAGIVGFVLLVIGIASMLGSLHVSRKLLAIKREVDALNREGVAITAAMQREQMTLQALLRALKEEAAELSRESRLPV